MTLRMLDLFSGMGGASGAMETRDWKVVRVDIDDGFKPDFVADVRELGLRNYKPDLIWGSPPCTEFSRVGFPWIKDATEPDMSLVEAFRRIVHELKPRWWILENVKGAVPYLGRPQFISNPIYLWGRFPPVHCKVGSWKMSQSGCQKEHRAKIPYNLSLAIATACESALPFHQEGLQWLEISDTS